MPKVTVNEEGAAATNAVNELLGDTAKEVVVTDSRGRMITLKKPGILAQYRVVEAMGAERAANDRLYIMVLPLTYVAAIDGDPVALPSTYLGIEALIQRLDEPGLEAIMEGTQKHWSPADPDATKAAVKN